MTTVILRDQAHVAFETIKTDPHSSEFITWPASHKLAWLSKTTGMSVDKICDIFEDQDLDAVKSMEEFYDAMSTALNKLTIEETFQLMLAMDE